MPSRNFEERELVYGSKSAEKTFCYYSRLFVNFRSELISYIFSNTFITEMDPLPVLYYITVR